MFYLDGEVSSIDIVSQEKVSGVCRVASNLEQLHQIVVLSVNISTHYIMRKKGRRVSHLVCLFPDFAGCIVAWELLLSMFVSASKTKQSGGCVLSSLLQKVHMPFPCHCFDPGVCCFSACFCWCSSAHRWLVCLLFPYL